MRSKCYLKSLLLAVIGSVCLGARLNNNYLPPGNAGSAGGAGLIPAPRPGGGGDVASIGPGGRSDGGGIGSSGIRLSGSTNGGYGGALSSGGGGGGRLGVGKQAGVGSGQEIPIVNFSSENNGDGNYAFSYETGNGITAQETGQSQGGTETVRGSYSYTGTDGVQYTITYTADADGFHPQGAHIPTPPPIPPEIQRGVELALAAEARGENQDNVSSGEQRGGGQGGGYGGGQGRGYGEGIGRNADRGGGSGGGSSAYQGPNSYQTSNDGYRY